jgi:ribosomal protein S27AE
VRVLQTLAMAIFNARVDGMRAEAGRVVYDVDVDGQKSSPWTYRPITQREDLWGLNIHTTAEERDCIMAAIIQYNAGHPSEKDAAFEAAKAQVIPLQANATCLRCGKATVSVERSKRTTCSACGANYALSPLTP